MVLIRFSALGVIFGKFGNSDVDAVPMDTIGLTQCPVHRQHGL